MDTTPELVLVPLARPASPTCFLRLSICRSRLRTSVAHAVRTCATNPFVRASSSLSPRTVDSADLSWVLSEASDAVAMSLLRCASAAFSDSRAMSLVCFKFSARRPRSATERDSRCSASRWWGISLNGSSC
jgi:hypothetical protein